MRLPLFLLLTALAGHAMAESPTAANTTLNASGKFTVGYEGRGDYLKSRKAALGLLAKDGVDAKAGEKGNVAANAPAKPPTSTPPTAPAVVPVTAAVAAPAMAENTLRGDSALRGDGSAARDQAAVVKPPIPAAAQSAQPAITIPLQPPTLSTVRR